MNVQALTIALQAACPRVVGVDSLGTISYEGTPTPVQQAAAQAVVATWVDPVPIPAVTRLQALLALDAAGLFTQVEAAVVAAGAPTTIWYANAATWRRDDPILKGLATTLNLSGQQVDALFAQALTF